ncbi:hypothetical protein [Novispirillum itersonii]|uniref:Uncharacterized protein n=1 Tax=Novispirillum itersonii TaxID=189 RepID=A0A7W9ZFG0_NOVIT|nr:hypothetical protein [Novispirillum itersonii]MBB6210503.1 hypothetical protein [Novispirillum itersonii]
MSAFKTAFAAVAFAAAAAASLSAAQASDQLLKGRVPVGMEQIGGEATPVYSDKTYVITAAKPVGWTSGRDAQPIYDQTVTRPVLNRDVVKGEMINNQLVVTYRDDAAQVAEQK